LVSADWSAPTCLAEPNEDASLPSDNEKLARFESAILPHLDAAYNLARWLTRHEQNAEDVVQEAYLRAYQYFDRFQGETGRAWLLRIVRNTCYTWLDKNRPHQSAVPLNEAGLEIASKSFAPGTQPLVDIHREMVEQALAELPHDLREVLVLREMEQLSYKEIAVVADVPLGTVMSRLARGRQQLHDLLHKGRNAADRTEAAKKPTSAAADQVATAPKKTSTAGPPPGISRSVP
jgi:RNA polymerase sigma factor (sigma-70 family)